MPEAGVEIVKALKLVSDQHANDVRVCSLPRFSFYEEARKCFAVLQTAERRPGYGNVILTKGVIGPDGSDLKP